MRGIKKKESVYDGPEERLFIYFFRLIFTRVTHTVRRRCSGFGSSGAVGFLAAPTGGPPNGRTAGSLICGGEPAETRWETSPNIT